MIARLTKALGYVLHAVYRRPPVCVRGTAESQASLPDAPSSPTIGADASARHAFSAAEVRWWLAAIIKVQSRQHLGIDVSDRLAALPTLAAVGGHWRLWALDLLVQLGYFNRAWSLQVGVATSQCMFEWMALRLGGNTGIACYLDWVATGGTPEHPMLEDAPPSRRVEAMTSLGLEALSSSVASARIVEMASHPMVHDPQARGALFTALSGLAARDDGRARYALVAATRDPDPEVREEAFDELAAAARGPGRAWGLHVLLEAGRDAQHPGRREALEALCLELADGTPPAMELMEAAARDPDEEIRDVAVLSLTFAAHGGQGSAFERLMASAGERSHPARLSVIEGLAYLAKRGCLPARANLNAVAADPADPVHAYAAAALRAAGESSKE